MSLNPWELKATSTSAEGAEKGAQILAERNHFKKLFGGVVKVRVSSAGC